jgi:D-glutamate cyclase
LSPSVLARIDAVIRRDPAARGLISSEPLYGPLCPGHLAHAAQSLATSCRHAAIVTGFFIPAAQPPAAETDGPPGAVVLATALESIGIPTTLVTDAPCASAVRAAVAATGGDPFSVAVCPSAGVSIEDKTAAESWMEAFLEDRPGRTLTHLIAIERVGPSHDEESLARQSRSGPPPLAEFRAAVPPEHQNRCHNSRAVPIDEWTAPLHRLFERGLSGDSLSGDSAERPGRVTTIGIGDGGNEIGMGAVLWEDLVRRLPRKEAAPIPCRVATDWNIVAGTSNWGAFALAAATLYLAGRTEGLGPLDGAFHHRLLERIVAEGPAVDGITRRFEPIVDGLPFATYIQAWLEIRHLIGVD